MTDRELLELAAKAAGHKILEHHQLARDALIGREAASLWIDGVSTGWNPLKDDGHALRLAVSLGVCIGPNFDNDRAVADAGEFSQHHAFEMFGEDKFAATRRAIVRAAAEIGRATLPPPPKEQT